MSFTISFIDIPAGGASARGIARINQDNRNPCALRFVFNKAAQLEERPTMQSGTLRLPNRYPLTDVRASVQYVVLGHVWTFDPTPTEDQDGR